MMDDKEFLDLVRQTKFDLAVVDSFPLSRILFILPYALDIPFVSVTTGYELGLMRIPFFPSFLPMQISGFSHKMDFKERCINTFFHLILATMPFKNNKDETLIQKYASHKGVKSWNDIARQSLLYFVNLEPVLNYPIPSMPHIIYTGGLSTKPAKPLPNDLKNIMDTAKDGVILLSFGSITTFLPQEISRKFAEAFAKIPQTVIWKQTGSFDFPVSKNVKLMKWIPQNDILGHPNTRVFITHSGNNGQYEVLYHGVAMLAFYIFGDQPYNAARVEFKGFGKKMDLKNFQVDELVDNLKELLNNEKYSKNIKKASAIFKDQPLPPKEKAAYWIEHVLKYGGSHLRSHALDLPWYQYLMLDILALLGFILLVLFLLIIFIIYLCKRVCRSSSGRKEKQN